MDNSRSKMVQSSGVEKKKNSGRKIGSCCKLWSSGKAGGPEEWCKTVVVKAERQTQIWKICNVISTNEINSTWQGNIFALIKYIAHLTI